MNKRKITALLIAAMFITGTAAVCHAQDTAVISAQLADSTKIKMNTEMAKTEKSKDGGFIFKDADNAVAQFGNIGDISEADMTFNLSGEDWIGFQLRSADTSKRCWMTDCYVVIVKEKNIEIQAFNSQKKSGYLANFNYDLPINQKINVKAGVIPTDKGNYVFIKLGDTVLGVYDKENIMSEPGDFAIEGQLEKIEIYETKADGKETEGISVAYDEKANKVIADAPENAVFKWYISGDEFVYDDKVKTVDPALFEEAEGVNENEISLQDNEIGKYVYCVAEVDGLNIYSTPVYASPVDYAASNGFIGCVGYTTAYAKGKVFTYDENDSNVYPDELTENVFLPLRGVMNGFGCPIEWDGEKREISITAPIGKGNSDLVLFSVDKQGFADFKGLMGSAMNDKPILKNDKTFLDVYSTAAILDYDNVFTDISSGIIVMSKPKLNFSSDEISKLCDMIITGE